MLLLSASKFEISILGRKNKFVRVITWWTRDESRVSVVPVESIPSKSPRSTLPNRLARRNIINYLVLLGESISSPFPQEFPRQDSYLRARRAPRIPRACECSLFVSGWSRGQATDLYNGQHFYLRGWASAGTTMTHRWSRERLFLLRTTFSGRDDRMRAADTDSYVGLRSFVCLRDGGLRDPNRAPRGKRPAPRPRPDIW